jgi:hypothetical protein
LGEVYQSLGIKSTNMMKNLGTFLFVFIALIVVAIIILLLRYFMMKVELLKKIYLIIHTKIFFNSVLRSLMTSFLTLNLSTFLSMQNLNFDTTGEILSSVLTIISLIVIVAYPIFCLVFIKKNFAKLG